MNKYAIIRKLLNIQYSNFIVVTKGSTQLFPGATHYNFRLNTVTIYSMDNDYNNYSITFDYSNILTIKAAN